MARTIEHGECRTIIIQSLRGGLTTGGEIATKLGVSTRTVYRYIKALRNEGQPIVGEAGVGYMLRNRGAQHAD